MAPFTPLYNTQQDAYHKDIKVHHERLPAPVLSNSDFIIIHRTCSVYAILLNNEEIIY
jgi:hypothetical protein